MAPPTDFYRPDGPYSWIVLAMVVLNSISIYGFAVGTTGVLTDVIQSLFHQDQATTNVVSSLAIAVFLFGMPFLTLLMRVVGGRVMSAIGAVLCILGVVSTAFVTEFWQLVLSYSVVAGLGFSFSFVATIGVIPHYLQKRRAAAYAGIGLGAGIGVAVYPIITSSLMTELGFKYAMLSLSTTLIFPIAAVIIFKPQLPKEQKSESFKKLIASYVGTSKHFVTIFFLINSMLVTGARAAIYVISFTIFNKRFESSVAVFTLTTYGIGFLVATLGLTLYALKFRANYLILHLVLNLILGVSLFTLPIITHDLTLYIAFAVVGSLFGSVFCFKGNVIAHLFPTKDIAYIYGLTEASGGIGSFVVPLCAGLIESTFGYGAGFFFVGACIAFSSLLLCLAALIKPKLWKDYPTRCQDKEHSLAVGLYPAFFQLSFLIGSSAGITTNNQ